MSIGAETVDANLNTIFLAIRYWYSSELILDRSNYENVNRDLWSSLINQADGGLFLKKEMDYFTHKITFTARDIQLKEYAENPVK